VRAEVREATMAKVETTMVKAETITVKTETGMEKTMVIWMVSRVLLKIKEELLSMSLKEEWQTWAVAKEKAA